MPEGIIDPLVYHNLRKYRWPGNVRELENMVERWAVIFEPYTVIRWEQVWHAFSDHPDCGAEEPDQGYRLRTLAEITDECQRDVLLWARAEYGTVREMAEALGVDHSTIVKKAKRLGVALERQRREEEP